MKRKTPQAERARTRSGSVPRGSEQEPGARKRQKTPWVRRIVSTVILLALLAGIVFAAIAAVRWVASVIGAEHERSSVSSLPQPVEILPCKPDALELQVTPSSTQVPEGSSMTVEVELLNVARTECSFEAADLDVSLSVGGDSVWAPTACKADERTLLLAPEQEWVASFKWDGGVYASCERVMLDVQDEDGKPIAATAGAGVYDLVVTIPDLEEPVHQEIVVD